jgi:hypothetical protein
VPADRDAAIASVVHVAAGLLAQASPAPAAVVAVDHSAAEHEYARRAIHFGDVYHTTSVGHPATVMTTRRWATFQGEINAELDRPTFSRLVGRPDLADTYETHKAIATGAVVVSIAGAAVAIGEMVSTGQGGPLMASSSQKGMIIGGFGVCLAGLLVGGAAAYTADVSLPDALALADQYNERLRRELQLPSVAATPHGGGVQLSFTGNGVALTGLF